MVMSFVWAGMLLLSLISAALGGRAGVLTPALMEGAASAVTLCLSLAGSLCLWSGFTRVMERAGLTEQLGKLLRPVLCRLFPEAAKDTAALGFMSANVSANLLGLGNAATPSGVAAVKRMQVLSGKKEATDEMCRLIVLNTASIQLLPTTVASVRASAGASTPFDILPAVWLTSLCSVSVGLLAAWLFRRKFRA